MRKRLTRYLETGLLAIGLALLSIFVLLRTHSGVSSQAALKRFSALERGASGANATRRPSVPQRDLDFSLWSEERIAAYKGSLAAVFDDPIAVLTIRRLALEVPVFNGTEEIVLNRGAGRIIGTARPGESGNIGIAGHRDGFFRCLKDIRIGDGIELATPDRKALYHVDAVQIVDPDNVGVLQPRDRPALTLVTCYPFYYIGSAPQRYIVHASIGGANLPGDLKKTSSEPKTTNKREAEK